MIKGKQGADGRGERAAQCCRACRLRLRYDSLAKRHARRAEAPLEASKEDSEDSEASKADSEDSEDSEASKAD